MRRRRIINGPKSQAEMDRLMSTSLEDELADLREAEAQIERTQSISNEGSAGPDSGGSPTLHGVKAPAFVVEDGFLANTQTSPTMSSAPRPLVSLADHTALSTFSDVVTHCVEDLHSQVNALRHGLSLPFSTDELRLKGRLAELGSQEKEALLATLLSSVDAFLTEVPHLPAELLSRTQGCMILSTPPSPTSQLPFPGQLDSPSQSSALPTLAPPATSPHDRPTVTFMLPPQPPSSTKHGTSLLKTALLRAETVESGGSKRKTSEYCASVASLAHPVKVAETNTVCVIKDNEGNKKINDYVVIGDLGRGSYGKVKLAEHVETKQLVAIKILKKSALNRVNRFSNGGSSMIQRLQTEIAIMKKLRHKNIVQLYEVIDDGSQDKMYIVMKYVPNGPILRTDNLGRCQPLAEVTVAKYLRQIVAGLQYLHRHNIVHRDMKPDNILLGDDGEVFLSDFGVSEMFDAGDEMKVVGTTGTPAFFSPELCRGEGAAYGKTADVWALGVSIYLMLCGRLPWIGDYDAVTHCIQNESLCFPDGSENAGWRTLVSGMLNKDPNRRLTLPEVRNHPWLVEKAGVAPVQPKFELVTVSESEVAKAIARGSDVMLIHGGMAAQRFAKAIWAYVRLLRYVKSLRAKLSPTAGNLKPHLPPALLSPRSYNLRRDSLSVFNQNSRPLNGRMGPKPPAGIPVNQSPQGAKRNSTGDVATVVMPGSPLS